MNLKVISWRKLFMYLVLLLAVAIFLLICINGYILFTTRIYVVKDVGALKPAQTVVVLGAGVYNSGKLSPILEDRVDTALEIYNSGKVESILVSGDNSTLSYNEVVPVRQYLLDRGVPASNIFLDYAGFNTYDSMYRARDVFAVESAIIVTQKFHMPRAVFIAKALGLDVQGYASAIDEVSFHSHIREVAARGKSFLEVLVGREPKFLGEVIPIEGDGRETIGDE